MSQKAIITLGVLIGSTIGGYVPAIFGAGIFSYWSIIGSTIGGFIGLYGCYKLTSN